MKNGDIVIYNNKKWKIVAIKGEYARIRLIGKRIEIIRKISDFE